MTDAWHSTPWEMTRGEFKKHADDGTIIKLRLPLHIKSVKVGFELESSRKNTPHRQQGYAELKLNMSEFIYDEQFEQLNTDASLNIYLEDNKLIMPLVRISSEPRPAPNPKPSTEPEPSPSPDREPPHAYVRRGKLYSLRKGKGFSKLEICMAGLTYDKVRHSIPVHKRRRSMYQRNVDKLKEFYSRA